MGEERIKSEEELIGEQKPLSTEDLDEVAGGGGFHEAANKSSTEQKSK